ncbi:MAG: DedA family protein [Pseudomonadota bacterium]
MHYLTELATTYLHEYGLIIVFISVLLDSFGMPAPGESLIVATAVLAAHGDLSLPMMLFLAWLGSVIGDNIGYAIGRYAGRELIVRYGRHVGLNHARLGKVEAFFKRFGGEVVLFARFIVPARQLNGIVAGMAGMSWWRFFAYNCVGAALWVGAWGYGVFLFDRHIAFFESIFSAGHYVALIGLAIIVVVLVGFIVMRRRSRRRAKAKPN